MALSFSTRASMPLARSGCASVVYGGELWAIGGSSSATVYTYNYDSNSWITKNNFPFAIKSGLRVAFSLQNYKVYAFGGVNTSDVTTNSVYEYNSSNDSWVSVGTGPTSSFTGGENAIASTTAGIYLLGLASYGIYSLNFDPIPFYRFNAVTKSWTQLASAPGRIHDAALAVGSDGYIYAVAGYDQWNRNEAQPNSYFFRYDPSADKWERLPQIPILELAGLRSHGLHHHNGNLYLLPGGAAGSSNTDKVYTYNIDSGIWSTEGNDFNRGPGYASGILTDTYGDYHLVIAGGLVSSSVSNKTVAANLPYSSPSITLNSPASGATVQKANDLTISWNHPANGQNYYRAVVKKSTQKLTSSVFYSDPTTYPNNASILTWTVPQTGRYLISAVGACGGGQSLYGGTRAGLGAKLSAYFDLTAGDVIEMLVGLRGVGDNYLYGTGGGGATVVTNLTTSTLLLLAGGGGGSGNANYKGGCNANHLSTAPNNVNPDGEVVSTNVATGQGGTGFTNGGGGGAGWLSSGTGTAGTGGTMLSSGASRGLGGQGKTSTNTLTTDGKFYGGFGGGGGGKQSSYQTAGGGGGYTGGNAGWVDDKPGGGGGSYIDSSAIDPVRTLLPVLASGASGWVEISEIVYDTGVLYSTTTNSVLIPGGTLPEGDYQVAVASRDPYDGYSSLTTRNITIVSTAPADIVATPGEMTLATAAPNLAIPYSLTAVPPSITLYAPALNYTAGQTIQVNSAAITTSMAAPNPTGAATVYAAGSHQDYVALGADGEITIYWNGLFAKPAGPVTLYATVPSLHVYQAGVRPIYTQEQAKAKYLDPSTIVTRRVEILNNDETIWDSGRQEDARLINGTVSVDFDRDERRSLDITLANFDGKLAHRPDAFWYDKMIRVYRGIEFWDEWGRNSHETVVGTFMIDKLNYPRFPNTVKVTARDLTKRPMLTKFSQATSFPNTHEPETVIAALASSSGIDRRIMPVTGEVLDVTYTFERGKSYWEAMKEVAQAFGYELFLDAYGKLVMRKYLDPTTSPVSHSFRTGKTSGNLVDWEVSANDTRIYNHISVIGTANDETPVWAEAFNTNPTSPTRWELIGNRTYLLESAMVTTFAQAQDLANTYLSIYGLEEYEINMQSIVFPWLDVGEIVEFIDENDEDANEPERFLLSSLSIPLGLEPMQATGKRVISVS